MSETGPSKRSRLDAHFAVRKSHKFDPPISREILGKAGTTKVHEADGSTRIAVMRKCHCVECGTNFQYHEPSMLCPSCQEAIDLAVSLTAALPNGNLPPAVNRTVGMAKPVSLTGVRPKVLGDEPK